MPAPHTGAAASLGPTAESCLAAARATLYRWAAVVSAGDLEELLALYASDAILVPSISDRIHGLEADRRLYFEGFFERQNLHCRIESFKKRASNQLGTVVVGGIYVFTFDTEEGAQETVPARFIFTFEHIEDRWLITGHHSSRLTEAA